MITKIIASELLDVGNQTVKVFLGELNDTTTWGCVDYDVDEIYISSSIKSSSTLESVLYHELIHFLLYKLTMIAYFPADEVGIGLATGIYKDLEAAKGRIRVVLDNFLRSHQITKN